MSKIIGFICLIIGLFPGTVLLTLGLYMFVGTIILCNMGFGNLTGMGLILGPVIALVGYGISSLLFLAIRLLNLKKKHVLAAVISFALISLILFIIRDLAIGTYKIEKKGNHHSLKDKQ